MKRPTSLIALACLSLIGAASADPPPQPTTAAAAQGPLHALPYTPSLDLSSMDRTQDPCQDFYAYACGGWIKNNPIPDHHAAWSVYGKLQDDTERLLWGLLQEAARPDRPRDAVHQQLGDYFAACMDTPVLDRVGAAPLAPDLRELAEARTLADLWPWLAHQHLGGGAGDMLFGFGSEQDAADSTRVIAGLRAGGLGLPDRDYYLQSDARAQALRAGYVGHIQRLLKLLGDTPQQAAAAATTILQIETELARGSLTRVERRDPYKLYHKRTLKDAQAVMPALDLSAYLKTLGGPPIAEVNLSQPAFFERLQGLLVSRPLADWKTYLRFHLVRERAPYLSTPYVIADFEFYERTLLGVQKLAPRWQRCVQWVDRDLGEALGQIYVERTFSPQTRDKTLAMVRDVEAAMEDELKQLPWMSEKTRAQAQAKLRSIVNKIGSPERPRDYRAVRVAPGDLVGNVARAQAFELRRQLRKIGQPVDRGEWQMTAPSVNAYYDAQMNDMNFPAGVLQPPLFDLKLDDAPNYGNTGATIGHELTHGFDDEGRQFDARGNLRDWWTKADAARFNARAQCVVDQYKQYVVVDDIHINSQLTLGEDVADLGGTLIAYRAWQRATMAQRLRPLDGLTPPQRFFVGYAQWACERERPEAQRLRAMVNPHSPGKYRVNGVVSNLPQFQDAFQCKPGQAMVRPRPCKIW